jgi:hypothetical protein
MTAILCLPGQSAQADIFGDVARVITAPITLPAQTTINILRGDDPAAPGREVVNRAGSVVTQSSNEFQRAQSVFMQVPRDAIQNNLGGDWIRAYDALTASQRVQFELAATSGRFLGGCMQGQPCNLQQLTAAPLAAAMRDAYKMYSGYATPLTPSTIQILSSVVPMNVLQNARIAIGATPDFTVPGMLNAGWTVTGNGHAVTLGNVMIFSRPLNQNNLSDWVWLLHEMRHTEQYMSYSSDVLESIDGFAVAYISNSDAMEADAQNLAVQRMNYLCSQYTCR